MTEYVHRLRLHGGRNYHAARQLGSGALLTACGYYSGPRDERLAASTTVNCRECARLAAPAVSGEGR